MHQPPTIPEGDEENEGIEPIGEGTRFPHTGASQQTPSIHDTAGIDDSGVGHGKTPTLQQESTDDVPPTDAEHNQPSSVDEPETGDGENAGEPSTNEGEAGVHEQLDDVGTLAGINEEENLLDESAAGAERPLPTLAESPTPPAKDSSRTSPRVIPSDDHLKPDEAHLDKDRRSAKSGRDRSTKGQRETPQVDFEKLDPEDEHDLVPEEPEIRISREELIARYQAAEMERDRIKSINSALQQRLADYLHKRKGTDDIPALAQGNERSTNEQQQRYQKYLNEIESLQVKIKHDQVDYEKKHNEYEQQIHKRKERVEKLKSDYVKLVKEIASKAVFARSGKSISNQEVENYLTLLREKEEELIKARHENIRLKNQLRKRELQLKSKEELAEGLHMIDFEQLKIENQTYSEKIEERNEELMKLRKKISTTVQILSHIKEKLAFVQQQRDQAESILEEREKEVKQKRDDLATIKRRRDRLRQENQSLKQNSGLIGNEQLLRDYEDRYDDIERCTDKLETLKKRHAEVTLMCKVLKKKISKV